MKEERFVFSIISQHFIPHPSSFIPFVMTPERWAQVDQLLAKALERSDAERAAFLAEVCAGDEGLRHEVESLLAAHQEAEADFLSTPALETAVRELAAEAPP